MSRTRSEVLVCHCAQVSRRQIEAAVAAAPQSTLESLGAQLRCGVQCGCCRPLVRELLGQAPWFDVASVVRRTLTDEREHLRRIVQLELTLAGGRALPRAVAEHHVVLQAQLDGQWVTRTYTVVRQSADGTSLTIAMRRTPEGQLTAPLLDADDAALASLPLRVAAPSGELHLAADRPVVCFVAGVGITLAMSLLNGRAPGQRLHIDYSSVRRGDMAYGGDLEEAAADPAVTVHFRSAEEHGLITEAQVRDTVGAVGPGAQYVVCGPAGYMAAVAQLLRRAQVPDADVHLEAFFIQPPPAAPRRGMRWYAYVAGATLALSPLALLQPQLADYVPSNFHNPGHEEIGCGDCHVVAPGTVRQQLQAKVKHLVGMRDTGADFGMRPVRNNTCIGCHANADDRHPSHRFLEPRFEVARRELAPHLCISCHREHVGTRLSRPDTGFCVNCHRDLVMKEDPAQPSHQTLIEQGQWNTCLSCHDFHGNHGHAPPNELEAAVRSEQLKAYFGTGESPYGERVVKAQKPEERAK